MDTELVHIAVATNDNFQFDVVRFGGRSLGNIYGRGRGRILLDELRCTGSERFIGDCTHNGWGSHDCTHYEDVSIACTITSVTPPYRRGKPTTTLCLKKVTTIKLTVALLILNAFSKLLQYWKAYEMCYKTDTKLPTSL